MLADPRADSKLALDMKDEFSGYWAQAEQELWPSGRDNRRIPWKDVVSRSKSNPGWPWMPGTGGMDTLKAEALKQGRWRLGEDGYIEKGPFPKEKATVNISLQGAHSESGESNLNLTPRNAGESPIIYFSPHPRVSDNDPQVTDLENFSTDQGTLYFLVKDATGHYESGKPVRWKAELKIRHQITPKADRRLVTLQCTPRAQLHYTLDGSNPRQGQDYNEPFDVGPEAIRLLVHAKAGEAAASADFQIPHSGDTRVHIDETKPARLVPGKRISLDTTERVFGVINHFREHSNTRFKGVAIEIGEAENTVSVRFLDREITAAMIEGTVNSLREILNETQAPIIITIRDGIQFESGFDATQFVEISGMSLKPGDLVQEE